MEAKTEFYFDALDGAKIHYLDMGKGKTLIFPHGYGSKAEDCRPQLERLSGQFRCIAFDQRGYGRSPLSDSAGLIQSARDMHDLIEYLKLDQVVVVGYSMGASVLFAYVQEFGCEYLDKVVIGDMTPRLVNDDHWKLGLYQGWFTKDDLEQDTAFLTKEETEARCYYFFDQLLFQHTSDEVRKYIDPAKEPQLYEKMKQRVNAVDGFSVYNDQQVTANRYYMKSMGESDFRDILPNITVPALLVYAAPGSIYNEETGRYLEKMIPDTRFLLLEDAGHMMTSEQMEIYCQAIRQFVERRK